MTEQDIDQPPGPTAGQIAYEAYRQHAGGRSPHSGQELPGWAGSRLEIQQAWEAAATAAIEAHGDAEPEGARFISGEPGGSDE